MSNSIVEGVAQGGTTSLVVANQEVNPSVLGAASAAVGKRSISNN